LLYTTSSEGGILVGCTGTTQSCENLFFLQGQKVKFRLQLFSSSALTWQL
jgi:hypothetical protein